MRYIKRHIGSHGGREDQGGGEQEGSVVVCDERGTWLETGEEVQ